MNFIALGIIAEIDDIYANSMYQSRIKQEIEEGKTLNMVEDLQVMMKYSGQFRPSRVLNWILMTMYQTYYYYFMPFTLLAFTQVQESS